MATPRIHTSVRQARDRAYRKLILRSAEEVFAIEGFARARMARVAEVAGVSLTTIYAQFGGKEELHRTIHEWRSAEFVSLVDEGFPVDGPVLEAVHGAIDRFVRFFCDRPGYLRLHLADGAAWALGRFESPEQRSIWEVGFGLATRFVGRGMEEGLLVPGDAARTVKIMTATYQTVLADWLDGGMKRTADELVRDLEAHFVRAFCVPGVHPERSA